MRIKLPTLYSISCLKCGEPMLNLAKLRRGGLTTFLFCRRCGEKSGDVRRTWPVALRHGVRYIGGMVATVAVLWLLISIAIAALGEPR